MHQLILVIANVVVQGEAHPRGFKKIVVSASQLQLQSNMSSVEYFVGKGK